jgi:predicted phosphodiesterase
MTIGVISDVHANAPALEAVLAALDGVDRIVHAGDAVGYGASPDECVSRLRELGAVSVAGNHDLAVAGRLDASRYDRIARAGIEHARRSLSPGNRAWIDGLPLRLDEPGLTIAHGSLDSAEEYVRTPAQAEAQAARVPEGTVLVLGHTHHQLWHAGRVLNPGAVGQTRDGRVVARFAVLAGADAELREVEYDVERAKADLRRAGLPPETYRWPPTLRARVLARLR